MELSPGPLPHALRTSGTPGPGHEREHDAAYRTGEADWCDDTGLPLADLNAGTHQHALMGKAVRKRDTDHSPQIPRPLTQDMAPDRDAPTGPTQQDIVQVVTTTREVLETKVDTRGPRPP
ncbi:hypothetical protein NDU88_006046 [Pleurodeles waltl]|uniref:Uncharacterized protein n=1 Tax=Pleurodeles waltl TaxID=8319 RepID=A0AAV7PHP7_PLEWA|nr:hypothetical protein NDU88_006046 [Pleurodeles waltl]